MRISKLLAVFVALFLVVFMASSAMAFLVTNRSAEMDDFSPCDRAGSIKMTFQQTDLERITTWLATHPYALIRIALNGTDLPPNPQLPRLCKDIKGTATAVPASPGAIPNNGSLVVLDEVNVEISNFSGATADADIYVYGNSGDQFISVYITSVANVVVGPTADTSSWFTIGLYDELAGEKTSICADVTSFSGISKLTISNEAFPNTLTFAGDNEIGHFLTQTITLRDCDKPELEQAGSDTKKIELCPLTVVGQGTSCPDYFKCFVAEGDFAPGESIKVTVRTNGATNGADTQNGVYLKSIALYDEAGTAITPTTPWRFYKADGTSTARIPCAYWEAETAVAIISSDAIIAAGNELRFRVTYTVNPAQAVPGTVQIWATGEVQPCGTIFNGVRPAASMVACGGTAREILFPYFTSLGEDGYWNGIVIANLGSTLGTATLTAYEKDGDVGQAVVSVGPRSMFVSTLEDTTQLTWTKISGSGTLKDSNCYIYVTTNFEVDGFAFMANDVHDSMGYLPRLLAN